MNPSAHIGPTCVLWLDQRRTQHPQQVVTYPHTLEHDFRRSHQSTLLLLVGHLLFLLHTKVCLTTKKTLHAVRYLGDPQKVAKFTYFVKVARGSESVNNSRQVAPEGCRVLQEDSFVAISINSLLDIMGRFDGMTFTVRVKEAMKVKVVMCAKGCGRDASARVYHKDEEEDKDWWCEVCAPERELCENCGNGCTYRDYTQKCSKHQLCRCQLSTKCSLLSCSKFFPRGTIHQHWAMKHNETTYISGALWPCKTMSKGQNCFIKYDRGTVLYKYWIFHSNFNLHVCSDLASVQLHNYNCSVEFTNPQTKYIISKQLGTICKKCCDWFGKMDLKKILSSNSDFDLKIITRRI